MINIIIATNNTPPHDRQIVKIPYLSKKDSYFAVFHK